MTGANPASQPQASHPEHLQAIQVIVDPTGRSMSGKWVGFDKEFRVDSGPWNLDLVDTATDAETRQRYDLSPVRSSVD